MAQIEPSYFTARRLAHVNLYIGDLDISMAFYTDVLGIEESYRTPLAGGGFVSNGNTHHDVGFITAGGPLGKVRGARPAQLNHIAFELDNEVALVHGYQLALAAGMKFAMTADHDVAHSVYVVDPDGNRCELYADVVKDWRRQRSGTVTKPKPQWSPGMTSPVAEPLYHVDPPINRVERAVFHPLRTTHAAIVVSDIDQSIRYYAQVAGLRMLHRDRPGGYALLCGSTDSHCLTLLQWEPGRDLGYHHVSMDVSSVQGLDVSVRTARSLGTIVVQDMQWSGRRAVTVRDPDGCLVQFWSDGPQGFDPRGVPPSQAIHVL